jgi:SAM-dependent methyltransferase
MPAYAPSGNYDLIADEYYDATAHPTSHALGRASEALFVKAHPDLERLIYPRRVLEIGAGRGFIRAMNQNQLVTRIDLSRQMLLAGSGVAARVQADARRLPIRDDSVDAVVAMLADPFNTMETWREVARVLASPGCAVVTLPTLRWAARWRDNEDVSVDISRFLRRDGMTVDLPSIVMEDDAQEAMFRATGLDVKRTIAMTLAELAPLRVPKMTEVLDPSDAVVRLWLLTR